MNDKFPITVLIITCNEGHKLRRCLESIKILSDIIIVDLESEDESVLIAKEFGVKVISHKRVPIVEMVWPNIVPLLSYDWIFRIDPDEVIPYDLIKEINSLIIKENNIGLIRLPHLRFFKNKPIYTSRFGKILYSPKVFNRNRVILKPVAHAGIICKPEYTIFKIKASQENLIKHYWADSYKEIFIKNYRYLKQEGYSMYEKGERFKYIDFFIKPLQTLKLNLFFYKGYKGGIHGILLSFFDSWYIIMALFFLYKYERQNSDKKK